MSDHHTSPTGDHHPGGREPSLLDALLPLLCLIVLLFLSVKLYSADSSYGANQLALLFSAGIAGLIGLKNGHRWDAVEDAIVHGVSLATKAMFILLLVGALIGSWIQAGIVPTLIHYGLALLSPDWFYLASCFICAVVALSIGSSWTVAGTIGVALMGVAALMGLSLPITAGAVISGAYFGDKMSPLSDTTNLAPAVSGSDLFAHIKAMVWTTGPSFALALIGFAVLGLLAEPQQTSEGLGDMLAVLDTRFRHGWYLLLPLLLVLVLAVRRFPALPTIAIGALAGSLFAVIFQSAGVVEMGAAEGRSHGMALLAGAWTALFDGYQLDSGHERVDELLKRGGMSSMLNTIWLVLCAMAYGSVMERMGLLERLARSILQAAHRAGSLVLATLATAVGINIVAGDQYMAIVLPGRLYRAEFQRRGLAPVNLSRALEDAGTLTSPLVPWNTCGAYMAATLGVATFAYLPFCLFNLINPIVAGLFAITGFRITRHEEGELKAGS
ncbi:MAG: Na+/H+ antiporter NhaC [Lysobacterales bacterium]